MEILLETAACLTQSFVHQRAGGLVEVEIQWKNMVTSLQIVVPTSIIYLFKNKMLGPG